MDEIEDYKVNFEHDDRWHTTLMIQYIINIIEKKTRKRRNKAEN